MRYLLILVLSSLLMNSFDCSFQSTIFNGMNKKKRGENLIISPLSIFQALSLVATPIIYLFGTFERFNWG